MCIVWRASWSWTILCFLDGFRASYSISKLSPVSVYLLVGIEGNFTLRHYVRLSVSCLTCISIGEKLPEVRFDATPFGCSCPAGCLQEAQCKRGLHSWNRHLCCRTWGAGSASLRQVKLLALEKEAGMLSLTGTSVWNSEILWEMMVGFFFFFIHITVRIATCCFVSSWLLLENMDFKDQFFKIPEAELVFCMLMTFFNSDHGPSCLIQLLCVSTSDIMTKFIFCTILSNFNPLQCSFQFQE